jgi:hypothetical protein
MLPPLIHIEGRNLIDDLEMPLCFLDLVKSNLKLINIRCLLTPLRPTRGMLFGALLHFPLSWALSHHWGGRGFCSTFHSITSTRIPSLINEEEEGCCHTKAVIIPRLPKSTIPVSHEISFHLTLRERVIRFAYLKPPANHSCHIRIPRFCPTRKVKSDTCKLLNSWKSPK